MLIKNNTPVMNLKRTFGAILSVLGIVGLIYTGVAIINHSAQITTMVVIGIISLIFFTTGISLVRNTKDEAA
ncbi:hypothetical protein SAMN05192573_105177 [Mucilaginibacter gossypii]|jgi:uncharacterized membrane protein|uniref:Uncharacterized protein n=2 Tax=Mucilaginibacter TaxID=423349 RepID=A0A1G7XUM3_9SPHI|nr:hypothetical protein GCM10011500_50980 [Mucilaginibacter rubeus]SCW87969.1 hypothetical protein SAMN03159284_05316 [Mucilaginibacter sp. NFR10]SDG87841.1 hypothetical protein SAMN05192573_105177 [Mucilaginibacter gossypii]